MALTIGLQSLNASIRLAYIRVRDEGTKEKANSDNIISTLSGDLATAVHEYMETAQVVTSDSIFPGQTAVGPFGVGFYTSPGIATGTGQISFTQAAVATLKLDIETAFRKTRDAGLADNASSDSIISTLSVDMKNAIHKFALKAEVKTNIILVGGVPVVGYVTPAGTPLPSISGPGKGSGTGFLS